MKNLTTQILHSATEEPEAYRVFLLASELRHENNIQVKGVFRAIGFGLLCRRTTAEPVKQAQCISISLNGRAAAAAAGGGEGGGGGGGGGGGKGLAVVLVFFVIVAAVAVVG